MNLSVELLGAAALLAGLVFIWVSFRYAWWRPGIPLDHPRILMYHMVREAIAGSRYNKLRVAPDLFEQQVIWLRRNGWRFVTVSQLAAKPRSDKTVAITFDDGYRDNLLQALPILKRHDACMTLYLVADRDDAPDWPAQRKAARAGSDLSGEARLSDDEVREMLASGRVELGAHSMTHADLTKIDDSRRQIELCESKIRLERLFGVPVHSFCYPFGLFTTKDPQLLRDCGYTTAVTTEPGIVSPDQDDPMHWPRVKVSGTEGMFAFRLRMRTGRRSLHG